MLLRKILLCFTLLLFSANCVPASEAITITEVLVRNTSGLQDADGEHSDWIELHNAGDAPVNLDGWFLTDSTNLLAKWRVPALSIASGGYAIVFASGKDHTNGELHTNFRLSHHGYIALIQPDGATIVSEFHLQVPDFARDISFGPGTNYAITRLVAKNSPARVLVPQNGRGGSNWLAPGFNDATWRAGSNGVGYQILQNGFLVRHIQAVNPVYSLGDADRALRSSKLQIPITNAIVSAINFLNSGTNSHFRGDVAYPGIPYHSTEANHVLEATGVLTIPSEGDWTFGVSSEYGTLFRITIGAEIFSSEGGIIIGREVDHAPVGLPPVFEGRDLFSTFHLAAGDYPVRMVCANPDSWQTLEVFAARGARSVFMNRFRLLGDTAHGGLAIRSLPRDASVGPLVKTDVQRQMYQRRTSAFVRLPFTVDDPGTFISLALRMNYDDGFVAWVNGVEVARRNAPSRLAWNSRATTDRPDQLASEVEVFPIRDPGALLRVGANVLAIQGLNDAANSSAFLVQAELVQQLPLGLTNGFFLNPTPGAANGEIFGGFATGVHYNPDRGFYFASFAVTLTNDTPGGFIMFTTDGSEPSLRNGQRYAAPIPITRTTPLRAVELHPALLPSQVETHSYIFPGLVAAQTGAGFPTPWGATEADYTVNTNITASAEYGPTFTNDLLSLPTLSIVMKTAEMFGRDGIYSNPEMVGPDWERACSVEWIRPNGKKGFHINCGIRIKGGASRSSDFLKHGFRLHFSAPFGPGKLHDRVFTDSPVNDFDTLALHGSYVDNFLTFGKTAQYIRDHWVADTLNGLGRPAPHGNYVHLYINGLYWGLYAPGERPDALWASQYFGGQTAEWDVIDSDELVSGNTAAWDEFLSLIANTSPGADDLARVRSLVDYPAFADYMLANLYAANTDWPGHNWYVCRQRTTNGVWRFVSWDAEYSFEDPTADLTDALYGVPGDAYKFLLHDPEFKIALADRVQKLCYNGGAFTPSVADATWMRRAAQIDRALVGESARWGDAGPQDFPGPRPRNPILIPPMGGGGRGSNVITRRDWLAEQQRLRTEWFPVRVRALIRQLRSRDVFPSFNAPLLVPFGGLVAQGASVTITNSDCHPTIYYTLDGSDPRLPGGGIAPSALVYSTPISITNQTHLRSRGLAEGEWSAFTEADYDVAQDFVNLVLTEIMYHPGGPNGDRGEFLELKNTGGAPLDLSGLTFSNSVRYTFSNGVWLAPKTFCVLVRDRAGFAEKYPGVTPHDTFKGRLSDTGDTLTLVHPTGTILFSFAYYNTSPWPTNTDGQGYSLVRQNAAGDPGAPASWRASTFVGGSPGADDPSPMLATRPMANAARSIGAESSATSWEAAAPRLLLLRDGRLRMEIPPGQSFLLESSKSLNGPWETRSRIFPASELRVLWATNEQAESSLFFRIRPAR